MSARRASMTGAPSTATSRRSPMARCLTDLEEDDRVEHEGDREADRPAIQVALHEGAAAQRARTRADAEGAGEPRVLPRVHEHEEDDDDGDEDLHDGEQGEHAGYRVLRVVNHSGRGPGASASTVSVPG